MAPDTVETLALLAATTSLRSVGTARELIWFDLRSPSLTTFSVTLVICLPWIVTVTATEP